MPNGGKSWGKNHGNNHLEALDGPWVEIYLFFVMFRGDTYSKPWIYIYKYIHERTCIYEKKDKLADLRIPNHNR